MGAGDAKFIAAATPFIALGDMRLLMAIAAGDFAWRMGHAPHRQTHPASQNRTALEQLGRQIGQEIPDGPRAWQHIGDLSRAWNCIRQLLSPLCPPNYRPWT